MTDEQLQRIHDIEYSCDSRAELAERIVGLEDELAKWERLTAGIQLPEYPITQFQPKDLERENAKLRELVKLLFACIQQGEDEYGFDWSCLGCDYCDSCDGLIDARTKAVELGIEELK